MADINRITISGRLVADPELHYIDKGNQQVAVCRFSIASDRNFDSGQKADFFPVLVWRAYGERCANNLSKGQEVFVDGKLRSRSGTDQETGKNRTFIEIHADEVKFGAKAK